MKKLNTKHLVMLGSLIALDVIFSRYLKIPIGTIQRVSLSFIPKAVIGAMFGPLISAVAGIVSDFVGLAMVPEGSYFPGFTFTAALNGMLYGFFLHKDHLEFKHIIIACLATTIIGNSIVNSLWLHMLSGIPYIATVVSRIPAHLIILVVKCITLPIILPKILKPVSNMMDISVAHK